MWMTIIYPTNSKMMKILSATMNEGSGDVLTNFSGNGNNGTILGAEWSNDTPNIDRRSSCFYFLYS